MKSKLIFPNILLNGRCLFPPIVCGLITVESESSLLLKFSSASIYSNLSLTPFIIAPLNFLNFSIFSNFILCYKSTKFLWDWIVSYDSFIVIFSWSFLFFVSIKAGSFLKKRLLAVLARGILTSNYNSKESTPGVPSPGIPIYLPFSLKTDSLFSYYECLEFARSRS